MSQPCACGAGCDCGCCEGTAVLVPQPIANRPGLDAIAYRVGTHATLLETMKARLSSRDFPELRALTTRDGSDPSIALLDGWAVVADVLTFYQERIANEGYLRTATERRSVLELARLVGYAPRPGVAASVYLAYTLEEKPKPVVPPGAPAAPVAASQEEPETVIPAGSRAQSVPGGPGETQQTFETSVDVAARAAWNNLQVRLTRPQQPHDFLLPAIPGRAVPLYLKGVATNLAPNDALLVGTGYGTPTLFRVLKVEPDGEKDRTRATIEPWWPQGKEAFAEEATAPVPRTTTLDKVLASLFRQPAAPPRGGPDRNAGALFAPDSDLSARLLAVARPELRDVLYRAWANVPVTVPPALEVCALRTRASVFGHNAPREQVRSVRDGVVTFETREWDLVKGGAARDAVGITATFTTLSADNAPILDTTVWVGNSSNQAFDRLRSLRKPVSFSLRLRESGETVTVMIKGVSGNDKFPVHLSFEFEKHAFTIDLEIDADKRLVATSRGTDPTSVTASLVTAGPNDPEVVTVVSTQSSSAGGFTEEPRVIWLDNSYPAILPGSWVALERPTALPPQAPGDNPVIVARALAVNQRARAEYGISGKSTRIELDSDWIHPDPNTKPAPDTFEVIRGTAVYAQCEKLVLAEMPIAEPVCGKTIELAGLYEGLQPGRWLIASGERTDVGELDPATRDPKVPVPGVPAAELVLLAGVSQDVSRSNDRSRPARGAEARPLPGETTHSTLTLAQPLAYCYKRDTVTLYGNVVHATHGETRSEVLGSGDGAKALQSFPLRQPPLTWVSAPTPSGLASTLTVRVNDLRWHLADSLAELGPADRGYTLRTDDGGQTTVIFGNGERGARLPTGSENVRAAYRSGLGKAGNVKAGQISQLASRPLGVKGVNNPLPASGGADRESRDQARRNAPLAVLALDRSVSVQDYEDFTRTFAGVGKASAMRLADARGRDQLVHVTIAGEDDIPIREDSDLFLNLETALRSFGDPRQPLRLALRDRTFLVVQADVELLPDYFWDAVEPQIRAAMLDAFGFARRGLGEDALLSKVYATIQGVRGVDLADVRLFARKDPDDPSAPLDEGEQARNPAGKVIVLPAARLRARLARVDPEKGLLRAQLLYLTPDVPDTLILKERKS